MSTCKETESLEQPIPASGTPVLSHLQNQSQVFNFDSTTSPPIPRALQSRRLPDLQTRKRSGRKQPFFSASTSRDKSKALAIETAHSSRETRCGSKTPAPRGGDDRSPPPTEQNLRTPEDRPEAPRANF